MNDAKMAGRPDNGLYIIQGEVNLLVTAMRRNSRWTAHSHQVRTPALLLVSHRIVHSVSENIFLGCAAESGEALQSHARVVLVVVVEPPPPPFSLEVTYQNSFVLNHYTAL